MKTSTRIPAYKLAAEEIKRFIKTNGLAVGQSLPPEPVMAQQLGISRPSLREGIKALESVGVLQSRHGEGVFVASFSFDSIVDNLPYSMLADQVQLDQLLEVREALEIGMLDKLIHRISADEVATLRALAEKMLAKAQAQESFAEEDRQFHATMFACVQNPFLDRLVDLFWNVFQKMAHTLPKSRPSSGVQTAMDHLAIVECIEQRDYAALKAAHVGHFSGIHQKLLASPSQAQPQ